VQTFSRLKIRMTILKIPLLYLPVNTQVSLENWITHVGAMISPRAAAPLQRVKPNKTLVNILEAATRVTHWPLVMHEGVSERFATMCWWITASDIPVLFHDGVGEKWEQNADALRCLSEFKTFYKCISAEEYNRRSVNGYVMV